jgi:hypothetical protein
MKASPPFPWRASGGHVLPTAHEKAPVLVDRGMDMTNGSRSESASDSIWLQLVSAVMVAAQNAKVPADRSAGHA